MKIQFTFYLFLLVCFTCQAQKPNNSNNKLNYYIKKSQKLEKKKKFEKASLYLEKFVLKTTHKDSLTDVIEKISELKKKAKLYNHLYTAVLKSNGLHAYNQLKEINKFDSNSVQLRQISQIIAKDIARIGISRKAFRTAQQYLDSLRYDRLLDSTTLYLKMSGKLEKKKESYLAKIKKDLQDSTNNSISRFQDSLTRKDSLFIASFKKKDIGFKPKLYPIKLGLFLESEYLFPDFSFDVDQSPKIGVVQKSPTPGIDLSVGNIGSKFRVSLNYTYLNREFYTYIPQFLVQGEQRVKLETFQYSGHRVGLETQFLPVNTPYYKTLSMGVSLGVSAYYLDNFKYSYYYKMDINSLNMDYVNRLSLNGTLGVFINYRLRNSKGIQFFVKYRKSLQNFFKDFNVQDAAFIDFSTPYYTKLESSAINSISSGLTFYLW